MAQYNIYTSGSQLVVELIVTSGDFEPTSRTFKSPSIKLTPNSIKFLESGKYKTALYFEDINEIDGVSPTDLEDAFDSISNLIGTLGLQDLTGYATESWVDGNFASKARRQTLVYNSGIWATPTLNRVYYISFNSSAIETLSGATLFTPTEAMQGRNTGIGIAPYNCKIKKIIFKNTGSGAYTGKLYLASGRPQYNSAFANPYTDIVIHKNENISSIAYFSKYDEFDVTDNITVAKGNVISPMLLFSAQEANKAGIYFAIEIEEVL